MSEREHILHELEQSHAGEPWHGTSRAALLADVTMDEAARRPGPAGHTIWELVLHMRAWTREVARRVREGAPREPAEGDWPPMGAASEDAWEAAVENLTTAHAELIATIRDMSEATLDEVVGGGDRDAPLGSGVSHREMLHGVAQHDAYHSGQIALLKRLYRSADASGSR
jgi:uncharacterized damage-inducible protein DinB